MSAPRRSFSPQELHERKLAWVKAGHPGPVPSNVAWRSLLSEEERAALGPSLSRKPTRTLSGVAIVAVMTPPAACPHGRCTYCPGGVEARTPQSYTGEEPSALRGAQLGFDATKITAHRLEALETIGHPTSKVEVILMGGTFPARPKAVRERVFKGVFDGLNGTTSASLREAQESNEHAARRCVSLTVETRPDWCDGRILPDLLNAGVTRVEIGVECLTEPVLSAVGRAHGVDDVATATREARDRGLKVCYHLMLGLPGMDPERDLDDVRRIFDDAAFRPDMVKIYPTLVLPGTGLYEEWRAGRYEPYDTETATALLARIKAILPPWVRVQRIQRDIPARLIAAGVRASNVRQLAQERLASLGGRCRCLRCREVGRRATPPLDRFVPVDRSYESADGLEHFLSVEEPSTETVAGFVRLRFPSDRTVGGLNDPVVRELKVLGSEVPVGQDGVGSADFQHRGVGKALLERAAEVARGAGYSRLYVLSAVGTREYYAKLGFRAEGPHMVKPVFA